MRFIQVIQWMCRLGLPRPWRGKLRDIIIDLRAVATRDDFQREMARHFPIAVDHSELWMSLYDALMREPSGPLRLRVLGWADFATRMPRYARRLKRLLIDVYRVWGDPLCGIKVLEVRFE